MGSTYTEEVNFYEGTEKLMEIWFTRKDGRTKGCDLRKIPRAQLEILLEKVKCTILSSTSNKFIDSYVLSESSMFVSRRRFVLKTCGTTTLLLCLKPLIELVIHYAGFDDIADLFYSHKNFMKPELQSIHHGKFENEVVLLEDLFKGGATYCWGDIDGECWYLYSYTSPSKSLLECSEEPDQTLEVLMTDLDPSVMKIFSKECCETSEEARKLSGIDEILPNVQYDDYLFDPCGYSMNGVTKSGAYCTIHITPEPHCSYVSFETNVPVSSYKEVIERVVRVFQPGSFIVTVFSNQESRLVNCKEDIDNTMFHHTYLKMDLQFAKINNYDLTYAHYVKFPS